MMLCKQTLAFLQACDTHLPQAFAALPDSMSEATVKQEQAEPFDAAEPRPDEQDDISLGVSATVLLRKHKENASEAGPAEAVCSVEEEAGSRADGASTANDVQDGVGAVSVSACCFRWWMSEVRCKCASFESALDCCRMLWSFTDWNAAPPL